MDYLSVLLATIEIRQLFSPIKALLEFTRNARALSIGLVFAVLDEHKLKIENMIDDLELSVSHYLANASRLVPVEIKGMG